MTTNETDKAAQVAVEGQQFVCVPIGRSTWQGPAKDAPKVKGKEE